MRLAIFDFDGTITRKDSLLDFIHYAVGTNRFVIGFLVLMPMLFLYAIKLIANDKAKEIVLQHFFNGWAQERFEKMTQLYASNRLPSLCKDSAMNRIYWHKEQNHKIIVVSASPQMYLLPWCQQQGLELIATALEIKNGRITGKLAGQNCYGKEKIRRLKTQYDLNQFEFIYAYGDSNADKELKTIAHEFHYRSFQQENRLAVIT